MPKTIAHFKTAATNGSPSSPVIIVAANVFAAVERGDFTDVISTSGETVTLMDSSHTFGKWLTESME